MIGQILNKVQRGSSIKSELHSLLNSKRARDANAREDYYIGIHYEAQNDQLVHTRSGKYLYEKRDDEVRFDVVSNFIKEIVDVITDHCIGSSDEGIGLTVQGGQERELKQEIKLDKALRDGFEDMSKHGEAVLRLRKEEDETLRLSVEEYATVFPFYDLQGKLEGVIFCTTFTRDHLARLFDYRLQREIDTDEATYSELWTKENVFVFIDGVTQKQEQNPDNLNDFGFIPFWFVEANRNLSGEVAHSLTLQDEINKVISGDSFTHSLSAFPLLSASSSNDPVLLNNYFKRSGNSNKIEPRTLLPFEVRQIAGDGVPSTSIEYLQKLVNYIATVNGVPLSLLMGEGTESGEAKKQRLSRLIKKASLRRKILLPILQEIIKKILLLKNGQAVESSDIVITMPPIVESDMIAKLEQAMMKISLGVSKPTVLTELGYDYEEELAKVIEHQAKKEEKEIEEFTKVVAKKEKKSKAKN